MAEQTFKSPGFFESEIDLSVREQRITGTPAGIIGTSKLGPAFVPVTVSSMTEFVNTFGNLDPDQFGPYAVREFLKHRTALTYVRVLGAGANETSSDITTTLSQGTVKNAGFKIKGALATSHNAPADTKYHAGAVQFIVGQHHIHEAGQESSAYPIFTNNDSFVNTAASNANIVRGMVFLSSGSRLQILGHDKVYSDIIAGGSLFPVDATGKKSELTSAKISSYDGTKEAGTFKIVLSSSAATYSSEGYTGIKIFTASLNASSDHYIGKILNKDPENFQKENHLLYGEFPVEDEIARNRYSSSVDTVAILSGNIAFRDSFGRFDTRYSNAKTTPFISQPFGDVEYNLFHFETLSDGDISNRQVKVSIADIRRSTDPLNEYGTFSVIVRRYSDTDLAPQIIEQYSNCNLDPNDENYVARKVGDKKIFYNFDATSDDEKRLTVSGKYENRSNFIRIVMNQALETPGNVPKKALPFGFRGLPCLVTNTGLVDESHRGALLTGRIPGFVDDAGPASNGHVLEMSGSIVPPVPMTIKATRGKTREAASFLGHPGDAEVADVRIFWGVKTTKLPSSASMSDAVLATNAGGVHNPLIDNFVKPMGIQLLNTLTTGSHADTFNNNKFTLAKVAFSNHTATTVASTFTGSAENHILEAAYVRNGVIDPNDYTVSDTYGDAAVGRITLATLASNSSAKYFNRFSNYNKFTNVFHGGFDGLNILDKDVKKMNDKAASSDTGGKADGSINSRLGLHSDYSAGVGLNNNVVASYRTATKIITDPMSSRINILSLPGQRDSFITDFAAEKTKEYGKAIYLMDIPSYASDDSSVVTRLFDDSTLTPSVRETAETFDGRQFDNNFSATYFPDVVIEDNVNNRMVTVPASIPALGAIAFNDSVSYPWFAPAGFNRGSLGFVSNIKTRLTAGDRDTLYEARINPIANFPRGGFVIFGQKTLQFAKSSLDRVNVRRMLLEVRRLVVEVANLIVFEQNTQQTRNRFIGQVTPLLATIQSQQGIDSFKVIMDDSNNTPEDSEQNRLNGRIVLVPTRAVEFIAIDFIITNSGVSFE